MDGEWVEDENHCPYHRPEMMVRLVVMWVHIMESLLQDLGVEEINA